MDEGGHGSERSSLCRSMKIEDIEEVTVNKSFTIWKSKTSSFAVLGYDVAFNPV